MYHGNNDALKALDTAEQRIKEERSNASAQGRADLLPGLNMALCIIRDTADDVAPPTRSSLRDLLAPYEAC